MKNDKEKSHEFKSPERTRSASTFPSPRSQNYLKQLKKSVKKLGHAATTSKLTFEDEEELCQLIDGFNSATNAFVETKHCDVVPLLQRFNQDQMKPWPAVEVPSVDRFDGIKLFGDGVASKNSLDSNELEIIREHSFVDKETIETNISATREATWRELSSIRSLMNTRSTRLTQKSAFLAALRSRIPLAADLPLNWKETAEEAFDRMDINRDGCLQRDEVICAIKIMCEKNHDFARSFRVDAEQFVDEFINVADVNADKKVDKEEFFSVMEQAANSNTPTPLSGTLLKIADAARTLVLSEQTKIQRNMIGNDSWLIHPLGTFHLAWDLLVSFACMVLVFTLPMTLAWEFFNMSFHGLNMLLEVVFMVDLWKNLFTGFIDESEIVVMDARAVRKHYFFGFFIPDFLSGIPFVIIFDLANIMKVGFSLSIGKHFLKSLKLLRIWKLTHQRRTNRLFALVGKAIRYAETQLKIPIPIVAAKMLSLVFWTFVVAHWMGCLQYLVVRLNDFPQDSWLSYTGVDQESPRVIWYWSLYKGLSQLIMIGFETPPFVNTSCDTLSDWCQKEHWMTLMSLYVGAIYHSFLISSILSILQSRSFAKDHFQQRLSELDSYSKSLKLPPDLRENIRDHFQLNHSSRMLYDETSILRMLTPQHVSEINKHKARGIIQMVPLLSIYEHREFAQSLSPYFQRVVMGDGEVIFRKNTPGDSIYFVHKGTVHFFNTANPDIKADHPARSAMTGSFFGEVSVLMGLNRTMTAITSSKSTLYRVEKRPLLDILEFYPGVKDRMMMAAESRFGFWEDLNDCNTPLGSLDDRLDLEDSKIQAVNKPL